jgi:alkylation response protein AidB-like acyl-CoA dehydrogenase
MDFLDSADEAAYRATLRGWIEAYLAAHEGATITTRQWQRALYDAGYIGQTWTVEEGGKGLSSTYDVILTQEVARAGAPSVPANPNYLGRTIFKFGTEDQKQQFLEPTLTGDIQWCQGFSEPGAGSDLASMRTRAELVGDEWVINGQKLWTSGAHESDWCFLLARSEPEAPKHKGISVFLIDMKTAGVTVRPVRTTDGEAHTCETFWDEVRIPAENIVGARGEGWRIAMWALQFERGPADLGIVSGLLKSLRELDYLAAERGLDDTVDVRRALAKAYVDIRVLDLNSIRQLSSRVAGHHAGSDGPVAKLLWAIGAQSLGHAWLDVLGPQALTGEDAGHAVSEYFHSRPASVYGGSAQIQRNLLSQRFLGMPRA